MTKRMIEAQIVNDDMDDLGEEGGSQYESSAMISDGAKAKSF